MRHQEIRAANLSDIPVLLTLCREGFLFDWQFDQTLDMSWPDKPEAREYFERCCGDATKLARVAIEDGIIVGYLMGGLAEPSFYRNIGAIAELGSLIVTEAARGRGIGKLLVGSFFEWCTVQRVTRMRVEVTAANMRALSFYRRCGFSDYTMILEHGF